MKTSSPGRRLKAARIRKRLSQQDVARRLHMSVSAYKAWEHDRSEPRTLVSAARLCKELGITLDHYAGGASNNGPSKFRQLSNKNQQLIMDLIEGLLKGQD